MNKSHKLGKKIILITRHGQRLDNTILKFSQQFPQNDTELSLKGREQAYEIGDKIKEYLLKNCSLEPNHDNTILISSPFARTLQTANEILVAYNLSKYTLHIDNRLSECIYYWIVSDLPLNFLALYNSANRKDEFSNKFEELENAKVNTFENLNLEGVPTKYESESEVLNRMSESFQENVERFLRSPTSKIDILHFVSHAGPMVQLKKMIADKYPTKFNLQRIKYESPEFCDTYVLELTNNHVVYLDTISLFNHNTYI